jgi:hypothetical protein
MGESIIGYDSLDVFVGVDVGKGEHHAVALDKTGKRPLIRRCLTTRRSYVS